MPNDIRILVTGATGFVGKHLCQHLLAQGYRVRAVGRTKDFVLCDPKLEYFCIPNIDATTDWQGILHDVNVVVHLAARVHCLKDRGMQALAQYQETNVKGTRQLARAAIKNDVRRFIYISTIKVNAEKTIEMPLRAEDQPRPQDAYSLSKLQAEQIIQEESKRSGMEWVIIRPPLIYGAFVKGNFRQLLKLAKTKFPLPLAAIRNRRSLVSVYNLCSFIECCLLHPNAHREVFLVSDHQDLSTPQLVKIMRHQLGKRSGLFPFPVILLKLLSFLIGHSRHMTRIVNSLQLNIEKSARLLNWKPPYSVEASVAALFAEEGVVVPDVTKNPLLLARKG